MMNKFNLIILSITVVVIICIGIYLYKNNQANTEPFYQTSSQAPSNPITIADMETTVMAAPVTEYAVFKMIGMLKDINNTTEAPVYSINSFNENYPTNIINSNKISIDNNLGKISLDPTKKYKIYISFNRQHVNAIKKGTELD